MGPAVDPVASGEMYCSIMCWQSLLRRENVQGGVLQADLGGSSRQEPVFLSCGVNKVQL